MPKLGDLVLAKDIGIKGDLHKAVWAACADCGKERYVLLRKGKPQSERCHPCGAKHRAKNKESWRRGSRHHNWKGGRSITVGGYVEIWLDPSSPFYSMAHKDGYLFEHRLVMAEYLSRCLFPWEEVHHRNRNKQDNRIENLELLSKSDHSSLRKEVDRLEELIRELENENRTLRRELR